MEHYIHQAKVGLTDTGPFNQSVVAAVEFSSDGMTKLWIYCIEFDGIPCFFLRKDDVFDLLIAEDEETLEHMNDKYYIAEIGGLPLGEYERIIGGMRNDPCNPFVPLIRYLIALVRLDMAGAIALAKLADGRCVNSIAVPKTDVEEEREERE